MAQTWLFFCTILIYCRVLYHVSAFWHCKMKAIKMANIFWYIQIMFEYYHSNANGDHAIHTCLDFLCLHLYDGSFPLLISIYSLYNFRMILYFRLLKYNFFLYFDRDMIYLVNLYYIHIQRFIRISLRHQNGSNIKEAVSYEIN